MQRDVYPCKHQFPKITRIAIKSTFSISIIIYIYIVAYHIHIQSISHPIDIVSSMPLKYIIVIIINFRRHLKSETCKLSQQNSMYVTVVPLLVAVAFHLVQCSNAHCTAFQPTTQWVARQYITYSTLKLQSIAQGKEWKMAHM